jgi:hypothetical protein
MKKVFCLYLLTGWLVLSCAAQSGGGDGMQRNGGGMQRNGGMLESVHIAYLTRNLNITPVESERFWPVYNLYVTEIRQARMSYKATGDELKLDETVLNIKKKYSVQFGYVLGPVRANQFFRVEKNFGGFVQKELMQRRQMRMQQQRRPLMGTEDTP